MAAVDPVTPGLDDECPKCHRAVGDHTIRGWGDCLKASGFDYELPYEEIPGGPLRFSADVDNNRVMVGEITVKAGALDSALGRLPVVLFTFYGPGLDPMARVATPEYALVMDERGLQSVKELINKSINGAIRESWR